MLHALPLRRRLRADRSELEAANDAEHLFVCATYEGALRLAGRGWTRIDSYESRIRNFLYTMPY